MPLPGRSSAVYAAAGRRLNDNPDSGRSNWKRETDVAGGRHASVLRPGASVTGSINCSEK